MPDTQTTQKPHPALERVRTDDHAYRVFEAHGVGTGFLTYDPFLGDNGTVTFDRVNRPAFDADHEARLCRQTLDSGGDTVMFEHLEALYWRLADRADVTVRDGRREAWIVIAGVGGFVCAEPEPDLPDGICGMPVESEPCTIHHPEADRD